MKVIRQLTALPPETGTAVALGFFDGVHIGHQAVLGAAADYAKQHSLAPAVFTFKLPMKNTLKGSRLLSSELKHERIRALGMQYYLAPTFEEIRGLSPQQFVEEVLLDCYHAKAVFCGENFTFGKDKAGNVAVLRQLCAAHGVPVFAHSMTLYEGQPISATRIRQELAAGNIPAVNSMLGFPYTIEFSIRHGKGLGHTLGFPTINQVYPAGYQLPRYGIYITRVRLGEQWYPGATGFGTRPTVNQTDDAPTCETFLGGFTGQVYGERARLEFYRYLAPSRRFDSLDELRACIADAAAQAEVFFASK